MGVKRFLVAGGMASLVLIGVVLIVDAKGLAQNGMDPQGFVKGQCNQFPDLCQAGQSGANNGGEPGGGAPTGGEPGGGAPTGAASDDMATVSFIDIDELPGTGGPSLVLLLASALLLGSTLLLVAFVRSVRS